jgi:hypothetical protein
MIKNGKEYFPPLRLMETVMTNKQIFETINTAFGGDVVKRVTKNQDYRVITFDHTNQQRRYLWEEFYEDMNTYGAVWIKAEYLGDECYDGGSIVYETKPTPGHWEVQFARRKSSRPWPPEPIALPKVCTCGCTCGARVGTSF